MHTFFICCELLICFACVFDDQVHIASGKLLILMCLPWNVCNLTTVNLVKKKRTSENVQFEASFCGFYSIRSSLIFYISQSTKSFLRFIQQMSVKKPSKHLVSVRKYFHKRNY